RAPATLMEHLGFETARLVWPQVRDDVRKSWDAERLAVAVDVKRKRAVLASDDAAACRTPRSRVHGSRACEPGGVANARRESQPRVGTATPSIAQVPAVPSSTRTAWKSTVEFGVT